MKILHLSDIHIVKGWEEEQGFVLDAFFKDIQTQISSSDDCYAILSGDIVRHGENYEQFDEFNKLFLKQFSDLGIEYDKLIIAPGNHDANRAYTEKNLSTFLGLARNIAPERQFNSDIYASHKGLIGEKFRNFINWSKQISSFSLDENCFGGKGFEISEDIGVYILNTALYSFGGLKDFENKEIDDDGFLPIETRVLHKWLLESTSKYKILVMHHPFSWLTNWAKKEIENLIASKFDLVLSGHVHKSEAYNKFNGSHGTIECAAPALFTQKKDTLGYSIIDVNPLSQSVEITYRHWIGNKFLVGVALSETDTGTKCFNFEKRSDEPNTSDTSSVSETNTQTSNQNDPVHAFLENKFEESLVYHRALPEIWITPCISDQAENSSSNTDPNIISADTFCDTLQDCIIKSPPQFGLSALGRYIALKTWEKSQEYVIVLDSDKIKNYEKSISKDIGNHLIERNISSEKLSAIILDERDELEDRKIKNIKKLFPEIPLIVLSRINDPAQISRVNNCESTASFAIYHLLSLDRGQIRHFVSKFIEVGNHVNEDEATQHLIDDLENLNLHRTPLNCSILLSVYQQQTDSTPVNRTEMLEKFLNLIFYNHKERNEYSTLPDVKDAYFLLGSFSEKIIRNKEPIFTKKAFLDFAKERCDEMSVDIDYHLLFHILTDENIFIEKAGGFSFRYASWLYYFAARRMFSSTEFKDYIINNFYYAGCPEVIEFYSGIDRERTALIEKLIADLKQFNQSFEERTKIDRNFDPYEFAKWSPKDQDIVELKDHIHKEIKQSNVPKEVKDAIADSNYNRSAPYYQEINEFVQGSSLRECLQVMRAAARSLRNSDYVDPVKRNELLNEILRTWSKLAQTLVILSNEFAKNRSIFFENLGFQIYEDTSHINDEKMWKIIMDTILKNVVISFEKDFMSPRMTSLIKKNIETNDSELEKFLLISNLLRSRPKDWLDIVKRYIEEQDKNSFYLYSTFCEAKHEYVFGFHGEKEKIDLEEVFGMSIAKHDLKQNKPGIKAINKAKEIIKQSILSENDETK